jgi:hypothetical protein
MRLCSLSLESPRDGGASRPRAGSWIVYSRVGRLARRASPTGSAGCRQKDRARLTRLTGPGAPDMSLGP